MHVHASTDSDSQSHRYKQTHTLARAHTHQVPVHTNTFTRTLVCSDTHTHITHVGVHNHIVTHLRLHSRTHSQTRSSTQTNRHRRPHALILMHTHAHTHAHPGRCPTGRWQAPIASPGEQQRSPWAGRSPPHRRAQLRRMWARAQGNRGGGLRQESLARGLQAQGREQHQSAARRALVVPRRGVGEPSGPGVAAGKARRPLGWFPIEVGNLFEVTLLSHGVCS